MHRTVNKVPAILPVRMLLNGFAPAYAWIKAFVCTPQCLQWIGGRAGESC